MCVSDEGGKLKVVLPVRIRINLALLASLGFNLVLLALLSYITSEDISLFDYRVWLVITFHVLCSDLS